MSIIPGVAKNFFPGEGQSDKNSFYPFETKKLADAHVQIVNISCSLNTTTEFYFANECSDVTVFV